MSSCAIASSTIDPAFRSLLDGPGLPHLEAAQSTVYGIWPDFTLAYCNPVWFRFATEEHGEPQMSQRWTLGTSILDAMLPDIADIYAGLYARCLREQKVWQHDYECSNSTRYRKYRQLVYPLKESGLLIVNACLVDKPHDRITYIGDEASSESDYRDESGLLYQCMHCRRSQNQQHKGRWDFVPQWLEKMPPFTSHGLCPSCYQYFYVTLQGEFDSACFQSTESIVLPD